MRHKQSIVSPPSLSLESRKQQGASYQLVFQNNVPIGVSKQRNPDLLRPTTWDGVAFVLLARAHAKEPGFSSYV